jgi:hypothetical protein
MKPDNGQQHLKPADSHRADGDDFRNKVAG